MVEASSTVPESCKPKFKTFIAIGDRICPALSPYPEREKSKRSAQDYNEIKRRLEK
jgi:hypothetical protein